MMPAKQPVSRPDNVLSTDDVATLAPLPLPGSFTDEENAAWDRQLPHEELVKKALASPPPPAWYEEDFVR